MEIHSLDSGLTYLRRHETGRQYRPAKLSVAPDVNSWTPAHGYELSKRTFDILFSICVIIALLPLFLVIALLVKASSPGPVLFKQQRFGRNGKFFWCYKFRTMGVGAEQRLWEDAALAQQFKECFKLKNDPRVTKVGAILRKTSLDELPQFFNVLKSEMSVIGPRPIVPTELAKYGEFGEKLLTVKPGLGGMWQVSGRSDTSYGKRAELDMAYIDGRSMKLDMRLLISTAVSVVKSRGAY